MAGDLSIVAPAVVDLAVGYLAVGDLTVGDLAVGALVVGTLAVGGGIDTGSVFLAELGVSGAVVWNVGLSRLAGVWAWY